MMMRKFNVKNRLKILYILIFALILSFSNLGFNQLSVFAETEQLYLGGYATGFTISTKGAVVIGLSDVITNEGIFSPAKQAGIEVNDVIISINDIATNNFDDIERALTESKTEELTLNVLRDGKYIIVKVKPAKDLSGKNKLGLFLRDKLSGIGTVTFIDKNGKFMALGHPICDNEETPINIINGDLYECSIYGVEKGERGKAGELKGLFVNDISIGKITENLPVGIKGQLNSGFNSDKFTSVDIGEAKPGSAKILTTIDGKKVEEFSISIVKVDLNQEKNRNYVIKITDKKLLELAGGIVQGMSGSPIVQDGKLVGAVTHVFVNDPTRGFGISIENMLSE